MNVRQNSTDSAAEYVELATGEEKNTQDTPASLSTKDPLDVALIEMLSYENKIRSQFNLHFENSAKKYKEKCQTEEFKKEQDKHLANVVQAGGSYHAVRQILVHPEHPEEDSNFGVIDRFLISQKNSNQEIAFEKEIILSKIASTIDKINELASESFKKRNSFLFSDENATPPVLGFQKTLFDLCKQFHQLENRDEKSSSALSKQDMISILNNIESISGQQISRRELILTFLTSAQEKKDSLVSKEMRPQ